MKQCIGFEVITSAQSYPPIKTTCTNPVGILLPNLCNSCAKKIQKRFPWAYKFKYHKDISNRIINK